MNSDQMKGKWNEIEGRVQAQWGKLTGDDMKVIAGRREQLVGLLQQHYGKGKEEIERQVSEFEAGITV
jgi:uncharacterized protein YjbJ (UPF0337 family)